MKTAIIKLLTLIGICLTLFFVIQGVYADTGDLTFESYTYILNDGKITITDFDDTISGRVEIPEEIEGYPVVQIGDNAFFDCRNITEISVPNGVMSIGYGAFQNCRALVSAEIADSVVSVGENAFYYCESLKSIILPKNIERIEAYAFYKCSALESVSVLGNVESIGEKSFYQCESLKEIVLPETLSTIGENAFSKCEALTSIAFPDSIKVIDDYAFYGCKNLTNIYYCGSETQFSELTVGAYNNDFNWASFNYACRYYTVLDVYGNKVGTVCAYEQKLILKTHAIEKNGYEFTLYVDQNLETEIDSELPQDIGELYVGYRKIYTISIHGEENTGIIVYYGEDYNIAPPTNEFYDFDGYYSEGDGSGIKLTDEHGVCLAPYMFEDDITAYPYYTDLELNKLFISGTEAAMPGDSEITYSVSMAIDSINPYATVYVKYPLDFEYVSVTGGVDFADVTLQSQTVYDEYAIAEILCMYTYTGDSIGRHILLDAFTVKFTVSKTAVPSPKTIALTSDSYLHGSSKKNFDTLDEVSVTVNPKLAETIVISGSNAIISPTKYTARVLPDYTTDKSVIWSVDDESIAVISQDGLLTPLKSGTVTITVISVSNPEVSAVKTVTISSCAVISSLTTDTGIWDIPFSPYEFYYIITVSPSTKSITFTPTYTNGTVKLNNSTILSGSSRTVEISGDMMDLCFERGNVEGLDNAFYYVWIIKDTAPLSAAWAYTDNGYTVGVELNTSEISDFESAVLTLIPVEGDGTHGIPVIKPVDSKDGTVHLFEVDGAYSSCKLMLWDSLATLKPLCVPTELKFE